MKRIAGSGCALLVATLTLLTILPSTLPISPVAAASALPPGFVDDVVLSGLTNPTAIRFSSDGRIFVAEKSGIIKVFDGLSDSTATVFADLRTSVHNYWDRGLLGLALDPAFPTRPYIYVLYTFDGPIGGLAPTWGMPGATSDGCPDPPGGTTLGCVVSGRVSRLQAAGNVLTGSEKVLVHDWFQQFPGHSIGSLVFGADGALYVSGGEGASWQFVDYGQQENPGGDPPVPVGALQTAPTAEGGSLRSQDLQTTADQTGLNGSVIRIDPDTGAALPDNPLYSRTDLNARRIVAYGFRNPFRMAVRPGTREIWVGDVGWRTWEEINVIADPLAATVRNFGWPCYEGSGRQSGWDAAGLNVCESLYGKPGLVTAAHFAYKEAAAVVTGETCPNTSASTSGLAFYSGGSYPSKYDGALFFADYSRKCIWAMFPGASGLPDPATRATFVQGAAAPVDLQIGPAGDLFYVDFTGGNIHRVRYGEGAAPQAVITASPTSGATPLTVAFDGSGSHDPDGTTLSLAWDLNGDGTFGDATVPKTNYTYGAAGSYRASLKVTDADGLSSVVAVTINAGNTPPTAVIDTPSAALKWRVGQSIAFSGHAADEQQGTLPASGLTWSLIMNHCSTATSCHEHQIQEFGGVAGGSLVAPDHEYPSYLTLRLTATDAGGLQGVTTRRLDPQTVTIGLQSVPTGLQLGFGSRIVNTPPPPEPVIVGSSYSLSAPSPQVLQGTAYEFVSWSDGGAQTHLAVAGTSPVTQTAFFKPVGSADAATRVLFAAHAIVKAGTWRVVADSTAAGGARLEHPDAGAAKITTAAANPRDYFELSFQAEANRAYRLWFRGRAARNAYTNDSVFAQFSSTVDDTSAAIYRIGTSSATPLIVEACNGCGLTGWGWEDNGYGGSGPLVRFASTGVQTVRIQGREDGISIDQIVLSPVSYLVSAPGPPKNDTTILTERSGLTSDIILHAAVGATAKGGWKVMADGSAASGVRMENPDLGAAKLTAALAVPADYFDLTFDAEAGRPYRLWLRSRALNNSYQNDSVFVQFSNSVDASGVPIFRIGTTDAAAVVLEDCGGCGLSGWGWQDNGYGTGVLGSPIRFATGGLQRIRIQRREDGISIDQIVLSVATYLTAAPGAVKNDAIILLRSQ
jgi:glucose/arabinose dehydrogenase